MSTDTNHFDLLRPVLRLVAFAALALPASAHAQLRQEFKPQVLSAVDYHPETNSCDTPHNREALRKMDAAYRKLDVPYRKASKKLFAAEDKMKDPTISARDAQKYNKEITKETAIRARLADAQKRLEENPRYQIICPVAAPAAN